MKPIALVGIAGGTCSGKSLVSRRIQEVIDAKSVMIFNQDNYYRDLRELSAEERVNWNFDRPEAFDRDLLYKHLKALKQGEDVEEPTYNFRDHTRGTETNTLKPKPIIILEGILVLYDEVLRELMDYKVFIHEEPDIRLARRIKRDESERGRSSQSVLNQYISTVRPMHLQYVEPSKQFADIIIPRGGENKKAIEMLANHIKALLKQ